MKVVENFNTRAAMHKGSARICIMLVRLLHLNDITEICSFPLLQGSDFLYLSSLSDNFLVHKCSSVVLQLACLLNAASQGLTATVRCS